MPLNQVLEQRVLTVEISRPEKRNTLDAKTLEEFTALLANAEADDNVRVIVITAQPGIFCAGGDLKEQLENPSASSDSPAGRFITQLQTMTKPMMACVEGPCVGFGTTILYYCDLVYAGASSLFSLPFTALGLTPRFGVSYLAVAATGLHKAAEKILLSEPITAQEALQMGMVSGVFEDDAVRAQTLARAQRLAKLSPVAVRSSKELLRLAMNKYIEAVREREASAFEAAGAPPPAQETRANPHPLPKKPVRPSSKDASPIWTKFLCHKSLKAILELPPRMAFFISGQLVGLT